MRSELAPRREGQAVEIDLWSAAAHEIGNDAAAAGLSPAVGDGKRPAVMR